MPEACYTVGNKTVKVPALKEFTVQLGKTDHKHIPNKQKGTLSDTDDCSEKLIHGDLPI